MKLKNKISGEIKEFSLFDGNELQGGATLESLTKEWEDAPEEPKEYYCIDWTESSGIYQNEDKGIFDDFNKEIGNYFSSREEAELALRKLKAWKRLKDKGLETFSSEICGDDFVVSFKLADHADYSQSIDDFHCIFDFGGEE